jgi:mRNA interferase RelE/StbE
MYEIVINREAQDFFEEASASLQKKLDRCFHTIKITPR